MKDNTNDNINWGLSLEMDSLINGIDLNSNKRVIMTEGNKQFMYDNGQIYAVSSKSYTEGKMISKIEFNNQMQEVKLNYLCNKKNDIIIE